jgi:predicted metal-binding protein
MKAACQPSKKDLLAAAAAEPNKQLEIKAVQTADTQVLNRVVRRCVTCLVW